MKDVIEALGVPHTEVDLVVADGVAVDFAWRLRESSRVAVYPWFASLDVAGVTLVRPPPLGEVRFVADGHLGRLARYLRMAGFDVEWKRDPSDEELARRSVEARRILLTRDRGLLKRREVVHGFLVRADDAARQLAEVVTRFGLAKAVKPFRRCMRCNTPLVAAPEESVADVVPPRVRERHGAFWRCPGCARIYWAGSHTRRMDELLRTMAAAVAERAG